MVRTRFRCALLETSTLIVLGYKQMQRTAQGAAGTLACGIAWQDDVPN
jgi:hypothetical protein